MNNPVDWSLLPRWILEEYYIRYVKRTLENTLKRVPGRFFLSGLKLVERK